MFPTRRITLGGDKFRDEYSLSFDGTNDYVDCGSDSSLDVGTSDFTACAWFKIVNDGNHHDIISKGSSLNTGYGWAISFFNDDKNIYLDTGDGTTRQGVDTADNSIEYGKWYHVTATRSNSTNTLKLYLDGVFTFENSIATNDDLGDGSQNIPFKIGSSEENRYLNGNISDVAYYNTALTSSQVKTIYNGREPYNHKEGVASSNLVGWWRMGDGALDGFDFKASGLIQNYNSKLESSIVTGWTNGAAPFNTLNVSSTDITSMINNDSGTDNVYSNSLTVATTDTYKVSFNVAGTTIPSSENKLMFKVSPNSTLNSATYTASIENADSYIFYVQPQTTTIYVGFRALEDVDCNVTNFKMQKITNNPSLMINMQSNDFTGDTP